MKNYIKQNYSCQINKNSKKSVHVTKKEFKSKSVVHAPCTFGCLVTCLVLSFTTFLPSDQAKHLVVTSAIKSRVKISSCLHQNNYTSENSLNFFDINWRWALMKAKYIWLIISSPPRWNCDAPTSLNLVILFNIYFSFWNTTANDIV